MADVEWKLYAARTRPKPKTPWWMDQRGLSLLYICTLKKATIHISAQSKVYLTHLMRCPMPTITRGKTRSSLCPVYVPCGFFGEGPPPPFRIAPACIKPYTSPRKPIHLRRSHWIAITQPTIWSRSQRLGTNSRLGPSCWPWIPRGGKIHAGPVEGSEIWGQKLSRITDTAFSLGSVGLRGGDNVLNIERTVQGR